MRHHAAIILALLAAVVGTLSAQKTTQVHPGAGGSPHVRSEWTVDGANISIEYGGPFLKGRRPEGQTMTQSVTLGQKERKDVMFHFKVPAATTD